MKKLAVVVALTFLFQSCFSYKAMDNDTSKMEEGKAYKIESNHKYVKVVFHSIKDSSIVVTKDFEKKEIPIKDITKIKKRKFSVVKTTVYPLAVTAAVAGLFVLTYKGPTIGEISLH